MTRRPRVTCLLSILLVLLAVSLSEARTLSSDIIGWYFDTGASAQCSSASPYAPVTVYLCITRSTHNAIAGWQLQSSINGNCVISGYTLYGSALNVLTPPQFQVGLTANPLLADSLQTVVLGSVSLVPLDAQPIAFFVAPLDSTGSMAYVPEDDLATLQPLIASSGNTTWPVAHLNYEAWPCASVPRSENHRIIARVSDGAISIPANVGGDVVANITINDALLDSLVIAYDVEEIARASYIFPQVNQYTIRVTNEVVRSDLLYGIYVFTIADSTRTAAFANDIASTDIVAWAQPSMIQGEGDKSCSDIDIADYSCGDKSLSDPYFSSQWFLRQDQPGNIGTEHAWQYTSGSSDVSVAVLDNGVDVYHPDLADGRVHGFMSNQGTRGTFYAGLVGAIADNAVGIAGASPQVSILSMAADPAGYTDDYASQMSSAVDQGADIVVCTMKSMEQDYLMRMATAKAYNANRIVIAPVSDQLDATKDWFPSGTPNVVAVRGYGQDLAPLADSDISAFLDFMSPGGNIYSIGPTNALGCGTSPHYVCARTSNENAVALVAGCCALLIGYESSLYNDDVVNLLRISTGHPVGWGAPTWNPSYGYGSINVGAALDSLRVNHFGQYTASGVTRTSNTDWVGRYFLLPGLVDVGPYMAKRYECELDVTYPHSYVGVPHVWGRGIGTSGVGPEDPAQPTCVFEDHWCVVKPGSAGQTGCTLVTYVYYLSNGYVFDWWPCAPAQLGWAYSVLGRDGIVGIEEPSNASPLALTDVYPNPFNASVVIKLQGASLMNDSVDIYDVKGRLVRQMAVEIGRDNGAHDVVWNGRDEAGREVASGVYMARLRSAKDARGVKFSLVK